MALKARRVTRVLGASVGYMDLLGSQDHLDQKVNAGYQASRACQGSRDGP